MRTGSTFRRLAAVLLVFALPALARAADTASHRFQELAPGVYFAAEAGPVFLLSNALVIVNDADVTVVDSHVSPAAARVLIASIKTLTPKPL